MSKRFAFIREPEGEALKRLSPLASKVFIAIRFGRREDEPFELGVRDLDDWSISKDQAARALAELVGAGLLEVARGASFGAKRVRRRLQIVHRQEAEQSQRRDTPAGGSRASATVIPLQSRRRDYEKPPQSQKRDIPKEASSPSAQKPKGEEAAQGSTACPALREQRRRVEEAARRLGTGSGAFTSAAGGPTAANELALAFLRGDLSPSDVKARLAAREDGFGNRSDGEGGEQRQTPALAEWSPPLVFAVGAA